MGRKQKKHSKTAKISFRISQEQKEILEMIAEYGGMDLSDLMRLLCQSLIYKFKMGLPIVFHQMVLYNETSNVHVPDRPESKL